MKISQYFFTISLLCICSSAKALTCSQFNLHGSPVYNEEQVINTPASKKQVDEFKKVISPYAGKVAGFSFFSKRKTTINTAFKNKTLYKFIAASLLFTRIDCLKTPNNSMDDVAIKNFNYLLDKAAE